MIVGIILILAGILIAVYPELLSLIVASILILIGIFSVSIGYHARKVSKKFGDPFVDFFFR